MSLSLPNSPESDKLVIFMPSGRRGHVPAGLSLLEAARNLGVEIESICGGRVTCGKCHIVVEEGHFPKHGIDSGPDHISPPASDETRLLDELRQAGGRLACCSYVQGDLLIYVPEESRAQKQVIRKSATDRKIEVRPAVRQVYVAVEKAQLGEHRGDWGRIQDALVSQWRLSDVTIDLLALRKVQSALRKGEWGVTVTLWHDREVIDVQPGYTEGTYGLAVDVGSTTIAVYLCNLRTGELLATESVMNPQVAYGEDLMSRVSYAMMNRNGLEKMHAAVIDALNGLSKRVASLAGIRSGQIQEAVVCGNTTMMHILLGINPVELGGAPFALANRDAMDLKARDLGWKLHPGANVHVLPSEAGHVGADNVGVLIAEEPYQQDEVMLIVDVGTNAEILLGNRHWMFSASSPTGPAFEGAQITFGMRAAPGAIERVRIDPTTREPAFRVIGESRWSNEWPSTGAAAADDQPAHLAVGICGSGIIEAVAEMFLAGIILPDGRFNPAFGVNEGVTWKGRTGEYQLARADQTASGQPITVTQADVRNIQLAKAALYAGAKLLMRRAAVASVDRVLLAGAFGNYIDPRHAMILGLIPDCALDRVIGVGNAAGDGARIALLNRDKRVEAQRVAHWVTYIETAIDAEFQNEFVDAIHLPHARDSFAHLRGILPETPVAAGDVVRPRHRKRSRR